MMALRLWLRLSLLSAVTGLAACQPATPVPAACPAGTAPWDRVELFFGREIPGGGTVSDADWQTFVQEVLAPAYPDGLTVLEGQGRWLSPTGEHFVEDSFLVYIYVPANSVDHGRIDAVASAYKARFEQETVLFAQGRTCLSFK